MLKSLSTSLILRGILALAVGVMALAWPGITVLALVVLFAVYAFMASGLEAMRAFGGRTAGPVLGHLLVGLIDLAAGVVALAWPGPTALVLVLDAPADRPRPPARSWTAAHLVVGGPATVHAGIDGEAAELSGPLRFAIRPAPTSHPRPALDHRVR